MNYLTLTTTEAVGRIEECTRMCCLEHGEERMGGELNWPHYKAQWEQSLKSNMGVMFLYEDEGRIVAGLGGGISRHALTGKWVAFQIFIYAMPDYRGKISIRRLVTDFEAWGKEKGCSLVMMPLLDTMPLKTMAFYQRMKYRLQQTNYIKNL